MDPEVAYIGNALSYVENHLVSYIDHPGTPTILLVSAGYAPLRLYTKLFLKQNFVSWSFDNLALLIFYTRIFMILVFLSGIFLYLTAIYKLTQSTLVTFFAWVGLFGFGFVSSMGGPVIPEVLNLLIISLWFYVFNLYISTEDSGQLFGMAAVAGLAVANKFNNFPIVIATFIFTFLYKNIFVSKKNLEKIVAILTGVVLLTFSVFIAATWQIRGNYFYIIKWILRVFSQSGSAHGDGASTLFDWKVILKSLSNFFSGDVISLVLTFVVAASLSAYFIFKYRYGSKFVKSVNKYVVALSIVALVSTIFVAKYPAVYYQFSNYLILLYCASYFISFVPKKILLVICVYFLFLSTKNMIISNEDVSKSIEGSIREGARLEKERPSSPHKPVYGPYSDFMYVWMRYWGSGIFSKQLKEKRPDLLDL